jgi:hypothetical protein
MKLLKTVKGMAPFEVNIPEDSAAKLVAMFPATYHFPKEENVSVQENNTPEDKPAEESASGLNNSLDESTYRFTRDKLEPLTDDQLRVLYKGVSGRAAHPSTLRENLINKLLGMNL